MWPLAQGPPLFLLLLFFENWRSDAHWDLPFAGEPGFHPPLSIKTGSDRTAFLPPGLPRSSAEQVGEVGELVARPALAVLLALASSQLRSCSPSRSNPSRWLLLCLGRPATGPTVVQPWPPPRVRHPC